MPRVRTSTILYLLVAVLASAPAWIVKYPPLEDLPFHVSTLRVIHSYGDPAYGFSDDFVLNLTGTQYALYYVVGSLFAYVVGVAYASVALVCLYLGGTVLAMRSLLAALGKDERLSVFVLPILVNVLFLYGLLPYCCGLPLMLLALAVAIRYVERPRPRAGGLLALLAVALFYAHVVPYALFGIGFAALFPWTRPRQWLGVALPVVPSLAAVLWWVVLSSQGKEAAGALHGAFERRPFLERLNALPRWTVDIFRDGTNARYVVALALVGLVAIGLSFRNSDRPTRALRAVIAILIVCVLLYLSTGSMLGDVWLLCERFPVPAMLMVIALWPMPQGRRGWIVTGLALLVGASSIVNVCTHFVRFQLEEVGDIDGAIDAMEPRKRVCALIFDKGSTIVDDVPFLHFGSYYQARKGGLIQFSNSGALYWPVRFKPGHFPPPGTRPRLRWEWTPERVSIDELYPYYDYVLARGGGFRPPRGKFHVQWRGDRWTVYARDGD